MKYSYYPGCSMAGTGKTYDLSIAYVTKKIGMELLEIDDWNCCGASAAHAVSNDLALGLAARTLAQAEGQYPDMEIAVPCASCYSRLRYAMHELRSSKEQKAKIQELIEMPVEGKNDVISFLEAFTRPEVMEAVKGKTVQQLKGLKVACYYGCLTSRPADIASPDDVENPMQMDNIVALTGASPVDWAFKTECCGASHQVDLPKAALPLVERILRNARANGAQAIVTACPLCCLNLDMRQAEINKKQGTDYNMPVYYFTELLAMSMGASPKEIGLEKHFFPAVSLMQKYFMKGGSSI
jgi:heterodisulfide reductase subunit B2